MNAFISRIDPPGEADLSRVLGPHRALWDQLVEEFASNASGHTAEWYSYSKKAGWALRIKHGKRTILYLSPMRGAAAEGNFRASLVLGGKAVEAVCASELPEELLQLVRSAKRYAEGTAIAIEVNGQEQLAAIRTLVQIKLRH